MKYWMLLGAFICSVLAVSCGGDAPDEATSRGGSCVTSTRCHEVLHPNNWDVGLECALAGGTWSTNGCDPSGYVRKCTHELEVSINNGPLQTVVYVYYFPEGSPLYCLGEEEPL